MDHLDYRKMLLACHARSELPFPEEEFDMRVARVREVMQREGLDALLVSSAADIFYLCGYHTFEVSVHAALVVTDTHTLLQVASIETGAAVVTAKVDELVSYRWEAPEEVIGPLADALSGCRQVGFDGLGSGLRAGVLQRLQARLGSERFVDRTAAVMAELRLVKSSRELACLERSARMTDAGLTSALDMVAEGVHDNEVAAEGARTMLAAGSEFFSLGPIVTTGARSGLIHVNHKRHVIARGDVVFLEFGAVWQRYTAPCMRTAIIGQPDDEMSRAAELCRRLQQRLCDAMQPDASFEEVARMAAEELVPWRDTLFHSGVFGYAVGAQFPPSWVEGTGFIASGQQRHLAKDMVFHLPLCLRSPGRWGIGLSHTVRVTERGAVPITRHDGQLVIR
nr:Xaa-Pro peptidase family protein [Halomonas sp.]